MLSYTQVLKRLLPHRPLSTSIISTHLFLVVRLGFEPRTSRSSGGRSTTELTDRIIGATYPYCTTTTESHPSIWHRLQDSNPRHEVLETPALTKLS